MITANLKPVEEKQAAEWSKMPPGAMKFQKAMKAHYNLNNSRREARTFGIALLAYVVAALLTSYSHTLLYVAGAGLASWLAFQGYVFLRAKFDTRAADDEYLRGLKEVAEDGSTQPVKSGTA